jgi:hypothetical protein
LAPVDPGPPNPRAWLQGGCASGRLLDTSAIDGDDTTTAAKKGGDNIGFSGHKKLKDDKVVAFCDRHCNVVAPFVSAPGNHNESPLLREALPEVMRISLDGVYDRGGAARPFSIAA